MRLLIFDTETSGLVQTRLVPLKKQPSIIEFYGCVVDLATGEVFRVDFEFERLGQTVTWPKRKICSAEATVHLLGYRLKLQGLYELLFEETLPEAHRARNDVAALTRCMVELFKRGEI